MQVFEYSTNDMSNKKIQITNDRTSEFDRLILSEWKNAENLKLFKYELDGIDSRTLVGEQFTYRLQHNSKRFTEKRPGESMDRINMPFNENRFNFKKIKSDEVWYSIYSNMQANREAADEQDTFIVINNSPIDVGHVLLVPRLNLCQNQILNENALQRAVDISLSSSSFGFIVGFNSLCALASVNHLHFHAYYLDEILPIQTLKGKQVNDRLWMFDNYLLPAFVLQLCDFETLQMFTEKAFLIANYLTQNEIPHNVVIIKGNRLDDGTEYTLRAIFYPRKAHIGSKNEIENFPFHTALCELSGHIIIKDRDVYDSMTENDIKSEIDKCKFDESVYQVIEENLKKLI